MQRREFLKTSAAFLALPRGPHLRPARLILYIGGAITPRLVEALAPSAFNHAILAFLYARTRRGRLRLTYNGLPPARITPWLRPRLRQLPQRLLISIGGWGNAPTFAAIQAAGVDRFLDALDHDMVEPWGLSGLDLDLEPGTVAENTPAGWHAVHDTYGALLVEITRKYRARHPGHVVTHAPISSVAAALYARDGRVRGVAGSLVEACGPALSWLNVQCYEAGDPQPLTIPEFYRREHLDAGFYLPGFEPRRHQPLDFCQATLRQLTRPGGVFLWDNRQISTALAGWATGLRHALRAP